MVKYNLFSALSKYTLLVMFLLLSSFAFATHYRAGEILYEQITERRYRITVLTYTDPTSAADPSTTEVEVSYGDGKKERVGRSGRTFLSAKVVQNSYVTTHEYAIDGIYIISIRDQNRVNGILNINLGNTEFIAFYVESVIKINNSLGPNRSPILTKPPIDNGCVFQVYYHNPSAYDPDGDSLTFELIPPKENVGSEVPNYEDPRASNNYFKIDFNTGQLKWDASMNVGIYNIAILIKEFRNKVFVGSVVRDMQITIEQCVNRPPLVNDIANGCVVVGDTLTRIVTAADPDFSQRVMLLGYGGSFVVDRKATYSPNPASGIGTVSTQFKWTPSCNQIRKSPWQIIFEAKDDAVSQSAVSQNSFFVNVLGPALQNFKTKQIDNGFLLTWNRDTCLLASKYKVYRRIDSSHWNPAACVTGVPASTGFVLIASINTLNNANANQYYDNNQGRGLSPLVTYCYRVVADYPPRSASGEVIYGEVSESVASKEICDNMLVINPAITKVSVTETSTTTGRIDMAYIKPLQLDTVDYLPPYKLVVKRAITGQSTHTTLATYNFVNFANVTGASVTDSLLNTENNQYTYVVDFYAMLNDTQRLVGISSSATSLRNTIYSTDRTNIISWKADVPWVNDTFVVYKKNLQNTFDSIAYTTNTSFTDTGLTNNYNYCYLVQSRGFYEIVPNTYRTNNFSQIICGTPIDTVRPCAPALAILPPCNIKSEYRNKLSWVPNTVCAPDVVKYKVYFKEQKEEPYTLLAELPNTQLVYFDAREELKLSIAGCYFVAGVDTAGNESFATNEICIDNCPYYEIPNVFTPNQDGSNDILLPFDYRFVNGIDMIIFNRWGMDVYKTTDIDIKWNGKDLSTQNDLPEGVYFYICKVQERYLDGIRTRTLKGTIQLIRK